MKYIAWLYRHRASVAFKVSELESNNEILELVGSLSRGVSRITLKNGDIIKPLMVVDIIDVRSRLAGSRFNEALYLDSFDASVHKQVDQHLYITNGTK